MRTKEEIRRDYLNLINKEKNLGYTSEEIERKIKDPEEAGVVDKLILDELYSNEEIKGQTVSSIRAFRIWCDIVLEYDIKTGRRIWNGFVKTQFRIVERNRFVCYMAARGHGKTFFWALYILFKMFLISLYDVCYCSNVPAQRKRFLKTVRQIVDHNSLLLEKKDSKRIANREVPWGMEEMEYNEGLLEGTTVGTTPRGGHYNLAVGDDPLRDDKKYTYEFIVNYFQGTLRPTIYTKKGRYAILGTPQDSEDLFHVLMNSKLDKNNRPLGHMVLERESAAGFYSQVFPSILDEKKKTVLCPEIWSYEELMIEKGRIGDIRFNREMMCRCITFRNALIGAKLFKDCTDPTLRCIQKGEEGKKYVIFVDPATSDAPTADYFAASVWEDGHKFILRNLIHKKGFPVTDPTGGTDDQSTAVARLYNDFNKALIVVEKNNAGIALSQALQAKGIEVIDHFTHVVATGRVTEKPGKANDVIDYIEYGLKAGLVVFPSDSECNYTLDILERVKTEHMNFGVKKGTSGEKYEAIAGKDDIFDSCWGAFKYRGDNVDTLPMALTLPG